MHEVELGFVRRRLEDLKESIERRDPPDEVRAHANNLVAMLQTIEGIIRMTAEPRTRKGLQQALEHAASGQLAEFMQVLDHILPKEA